MTERIEPGAGYTNWQSNPAKAARIWRPDGPPGHEVAQRERFDGRVDGRVGGTYVDAETEEAYRKGLIVVDHSQQFTLADLEAALLIAKTEWQADPQDEKKKRAYQQLAGQVRQARQQVRAADPRRNRRKG